MPESMKHTTFSKTSDVEVEGTSCFWLPQSTNRNDFQMEEVIVFFTTIVVPIIWQSAFSNFTYFNIFAIVLVVIFDTIDYFI